MRKHRSLKFAAVALAAATAATLVAATAAAQEWKVRFQTNEFPRPGVLQLRETAPGQHLLRVLVPGWGDWRDHCVMRDQPAQVEQQPGQQVVLVQPPRGCAEFRIVLKEDGSGRREVRGAEGAWVHDEKMEFLGRKQ